MSPLRQGLVVILGAAFLGAAIVVERGLIALVVPGVAGVLLLVVLVRRLAGDPSTSTRLMWWTLGAFVAHLLFGLLIHSSAAATKYLGPDAYAYHQDAIGIVRHWTDGVDLPRLPGGKEGYYYLLAGLYWVFGAFQWTAVVVNAVLAAALVPMISDTTRRLFGPVPARYVAPLVVLLPGLFIWTSQPIKEAPILLLIAIVANLGVRLVDGSTPGRLIGLAVTSGVLFTFRSFVGLALVGGLVCGIALGRRLVVSGVAVGASTVLLVGLLMATSGLGYSGYQAAVRTDLRQASNVRLDLATVSSGFGADVDISTTRQAVSYLPVGMATFVLGPFPWQISGARQLPAVVDALVWWCLLPSLWRGYRAGRRLVGRKLLVVLLPTGVATVLLSLVVANFGTVLRQRLQITVLLIPLIALGLAERSSRRQARDTDRQLVPARMTPALDHAPVIATGLD